MIQVSVDEKVVAQLMQGVTDRSVEDVVREALQFAASNEGVRKTPDPAALAQAMENFHARYGHIEDEGFEEELLFDELPGVSAVVIPRTE